MRPELIVAEKEFRDHLVSKRFLMIFAVLLLLAVFGMVTGMDQYNKYLDSYRTLTVQNPQTGLPVDRYMPSALYVLGGINGGNSFAGGFFTIVLLLLSMTIGFDLITREKEEGSLKSLLSHPVYRDEVINGKLMGGMAILALALGSVFVIIIAIMMLYGIVPTADDLARLVAYFVLALLYCGSIFAFATVFSTISRTSTMSIFGVIGVILLFVIFPTITSNIATAALGQAPELPQSYREMQANNMNGTASGTGGGPNDHRTVEQLMKDPGYQRYVQYYQQYLTITDTLSTLSPVYDFTERISPALLYKQSADTGSNMGTSIANRSAIAIVPTLFDSLAYVWVQILVLLVYIAVPLALTYVLFLRLDVR